jgi:hypothetical protein
LLRYKDVIFLIFSVFRAVGFGGVSVLVVLYVKYFNNFISTDFASTVKSYNSL